MQIKITKPGIFSATGEVAVGTVLTVKEAPKGWAGRFEAIEGGATPVTNPVGGGVAMDEGRQALLADVALVLPDDAFNDDGVPDVRAVNAKLDEDMKRFSAAERDALWPGIADDVKEARA